MRELLVEELRRILSDLLQGVIGLFLRLLRILLLFLEVPHDGVEHSNDGLAKATFPGAAQGPSLWGRLRFLLGLITSIHLVVVHLDQALGILRLIKALDDALGFLHDLHCELPVFGRLLVRRLFLGSCGLQLLQPVGECLRLGFQLLHLLGSRPDLRLQKGFPGLQAHKVAFDLCLRVLVVPHLDLAEVLPFGILFLMAFDCINQAKNRLCSFAHAFHLVMGLVLHQRDRSAERVFLLLAFCVAL
mmetsp:Transcript_91530/g.218220  ORF Transcript_91530/g.218220 Transcript_91530/m.218220 type:complete len:245 (+) Transcript_91530:334-1068(+)